MDLSSFVRRDISGIRKDILPLSGFGILSHALADEIAARNQAGEGYFYTTDMEFLEEGEPEQQPVLPPVSHRPETVRMDMNILFKIVQESGENGKAPPAGTRKMLERVRTILRADPQGRPMPAPQPMQQSVQQRNIPLMQGTRSTPTTTPVSSVSSAQSASQMPRQRSSVRTLTRDRMQNPLRDPKAPLTVERMHTPAHEVPRASDHAMLFSDVLHRAQDSGLTFAPRQGQGGVPASAQTRAAYTTQTLRQAKAEQQVAEARSAPAWQRTALKEASQTPSGAAGASWQFDETVGENAKTNDIRKNIARDPASDAVRNAAPAALPNDVPLAVPDAAGHPLPEPEQAGEALSALTGDRAFAQTPEEAADVLRQMAAPRYPEAELDFAREDAPQEGAEMPVPTAQHPGTEALRAVQEASTDALTETVRTALKEAAPLMTAPAASSPAMTAPAATAAAQDAPSFRNTQAAQREPAGEPGQTARPIQNTDQSKAALQETQKQAEQAARDTAMQALNETTVQPDAVLKDRQASRNIPQRSDNTVENRTESAGKIDVAHTAERTPALTGDRAFVQTTEEAGSALRRMAAPRYPEAELDFVQEQAPQEGAETPVSTAQHPNTETLRAMQEASTKALTETVRSALREAAPLMTAPAVSSPAMTAPAATADARNAQPAQNAQTAPHPGQSRAALREMQKQAEQAMQQTVMQALNETAARSGIMPQARQESRNIPPQADTVVENRTEKAGKNANRQTEMSAGAVDAEHPEMLEKMLGQPKAQSGRTPQSQAVESEANVEAETAASPDADRTNAETMAEDAGATGERVPALTGDRAFAQTPEEAADILRRMAAPRYPEAELDFVQEEAPQEGAEMPVSTAQHPSTEALRAMQEASTKALTETVRSALKEAAPLVTAPAAANAARNAQTVRNTQTVQDTRAEPSGQTVTHPGQSRAALQEMRKQAEQAARETAVQTLSETAARQTTQTAQPRTETAKEAREFAGTMKNRASAPQTGGVLPDGPDASYPTDEMENRLPPLSGGQALPGQPVGRFAGQTGGMERAVELLRQNGYGAPQLEYRMEDAGPEAPETAPMSGLPRQAGAAAKKSLLWLGEKVAANAARELSRMRRTMPEQRARSGSVGSAGSAVQRNQKAKPGIASPAGEMNPKNQPGSSNTSGQWSQPGRPGRSGNAGSPTSVRQTGSDSRNGGTFQTASQRADWMGYRPIDMAHPAARTAGWTAARPMGIPAEAQWRPSGQAAPAMVSPAEMPHLMYQTGQTESGEIPFAPAGSSARPALPRLGTGLEAESAYPALSMEYSSPMSRMEQQLQSAVAQQMSAASRPMGMQTEAGQYMAGKAAPGGMTTLDQMSAPPVNDQIVWQNPYLRSAPADMTYRNKKKPPEQSQPAPRPQTVRMSDAEIHRMADQVFRIVKDKIRQERRKMGL